MKLSVLIKHLTAVHKLCGDLDVVCTSGDYYHAEFLVTLHEFDGTSARRLVLDTSEHSPEDQYDEPFCEYPEDEGDFN